MANIRITDLTAYTDPVNTDVLPIVDVTADVTKKVSISNLMKNASAGTAAAPSISFDGDPNTGIYTPGADQVSITTGGIDRLYIDATGQIEAGSRGTAAAPTFSFTVDPNTGVYSPGVDQLAISTAGSGRLFVDASGRVGINTATPGSYNAAADNLVIVDSGNAGITITTGTTSYGAIHFADGTVGADQYRGIVEYNHSSNAMAFWTNATERARIDSSGRLLVGTNSDSGGALFQVNGDRIRVATAKTPASATDTGTTGEICWDANYIYVCTATNTWKRSALATW